MSNRTAIYMRVSTVEQKPDLQLDGLIAFAKRSELNITHQYLDMAISGRKQGRPELNKLMVAARDYDFDNVLVWKFDRFARSTKHLLSALEEFNHLGIRFISVRDQIDTSSPMGKAMFTLIGAMSELESSLISERVSAGMKAAQVRGKQLGRPRTSQGHIEQIEHLAETTTLSVRGIQDKMGGRVSRGVVGEVVKRSRNLK